MSQRIDYVDQVKGFAIFLVVWGHTMQYFGINSSINYWVYFNIVLSFHMPLFAFLSGMFLKNEQSILDSIKRKFRQIEVPHIFWSLLIFLFFPIITIILKREENLHLFAISRNMYLEIMNWNFWFLRALFLCYVYALLSIGIFKIKKIFFLCISVVVLYGLGWSGIIPNMGVMLNGFFFLYPFFVMGKLYSHYDSKFDRYSILIIIFSLIVFTIGLFLWRGYPDTFYEMNTSIIEPSGYENIVGIEIVYRSTLRFIMGLSGSFLCILFFKHINKSQYFRKIKSFLRNLGQHTLAIYILQSIVFIYIPGRNLWEHQILIVPSCILIALLIIGISYCISLLTSKINYLSFLMWGKPINSNI